MGAEGSKEGADGLERIPLPVPVLAASGAGGDSRRPSSSGAPSGNTKPGDKPPAGGSKTQWMRPAQTKAATTTEVRQSTSKLPPGARPKLSGSGAPPGEGMDPAQLAAEEQYKQRLENSKKELVKKLAVQIKTLKDPASIPPARTPVVKAVSARLAEGKRSWLGKLTKNKAAALQLLGAGGAGGPGGKYLAPMSQEAVAGRVEGSLAANLEPFGNFQGALHHIIDSGVGDDVLDQFFFDEEEERVLPTYQKWRIIRHAAEQVLAVYANRSNSQWIEDESWAAANVVHTTAASLSMYSNTVDTALTAGNIALLFVDDGRLAEMGGDEVSPLVATDLWQAIKELAPNKVPSGQRVERLSVAGRHLLHAAVSIEMWYGAAALRQLRVVLAIDCDCEYFVVSELAQWGFFGLEPANVVLLPLPRFHGFAQDMRSGHLAHVKGSPRLMLGTGYAMFLLNSPAEAYTLSADGLEPQCLQGSVLEWLADAKASWLYTGLFSDVERLRPEALFDMDFLAAGLAAADRTGSNMAVEVLQGEHERQARLHDSLVLSRATSPRSPSGAAAAATASASASPAFGRTPSAQLPPAATAAAAAAGGTSPSGSRPSTTSSSGARTGTSSSGARPAASSAGSGAPGAAAGAAAAAAAAAAPTASNCNLRVSSMRTAKSYQLMKGATASPHGFYVAAHRYMFSTRALQRLLLDPGAFHADVYLQGFYAYATFDISDLTTFAGANCACILGTQGLRAPVMSEVIFGREWLSYSAAILQLQDNVKEFRRKAVQLYDKAKTVNTGPNKCSTFKDKGGYNVLLVVTPEHLRLIRPAIRLARLFVHNIVDRLHCYLLVTEGESKSRIKELYDVLTDKELEFNGQLAREVVVRPAGASVVEVVAGLLPKIKAHMLVVPSERLCITGTSADLGQLAGSAALGLARAITSVPLLIVKANTVGKYLHVPAAAAGGGGAAGGAGGGGTGLPSRGSQSSLQAAAAGGSGVGKDVISAMVHLDTTSVGPLVEFVSAALAGGTDGLVLARTAAMERDGALTMRSRRVFVQARMAVAQAIRVEERAYAGSGSAELPKAVEVEGVDLLALSCPPDLTISKECEQLLQLCRTSVLIHRAMTAAPGSAASAWS